jgi:hypothetical protein
VRTRAPVLPLVQRAAPVPSFIMPPLHPHSPFPIQAFRIIPSPSQIPAHRATNQTANNSPCPVTSSKMQFQPLQQLPRTARLRIPEFLALLPPCFSYSWRAPKTPAAASRFTAIRRAQMRNDLHAFMFTPFRNSHHCTTFRPVDTDLAASHCAFSVI